MLDVLGVSDYSLEQCIELMKKKDRLVEFLKSTAGFKFVEEKSKTKVKYYQFGDSIMISCACGIDSGYLAIFMEPLTKLMLMGFSEKLLLRGAVSIGEYVENVGVNNVTVIDPAVTDAASWYEATDWAGIIATPRTTNVLEWFLCTIRNKNIHDSLKAFDELLIKYPVPLKTGEEEMWAVNWPSAMILKDNEKFSTDDAYEDLLRNIAKIELIPKGTEKKYNNTMKFVHKSLNKKTTEHFEIE